MSKINTFENGDDIYKLNYNKSDHGRVFIFNNFHFCRNGNKNISDECKRAKCRLGSEYDVKDLTELFEELKFEVECIIDKTAKEIRNKIDELSKKDFNESDCLIVVIMSHGQTNSEGFDEICGRDKKCIRLTEFINPFKTVKSLKSKPKLFFVNACRVPENEDRNFVPVFCQESKNKDGECEFICEKKGNYFSHENAKTAKVCQKAPLGVQIDFLVSFATAGGYFSVRNINSGSWFIQSLCKMIKEFKSKKNILAILTKVNNEVANMERIKSKKIFCVKNDMLIKMMPTCIHQLTKEFYFEKPKSIEVYLKFMLNLKISKIFN